MVAAWEHLTQQPEVKITIAIPHTSITHVRWAMAIRSLVIPNGTVFNLSRGHPWDITRNSLVKDAINNGSTHILFLDSDVCPPSDGLTKLLKHNLPIVSGLYYCRHRADIVVPESMPIPMPPTPAMWINNGQGAYNPIINWPPGSMVQCNVIGCGFSLIHTSVFKRLDKELNRNGVYFKWTAGLNDNNYTEGLPGVSEDFFFFRMVEKLGIPVYVDTSCICQHMSMSSVVDGKGIDFSLI